MRQKNGKSVWLLCVNDFHGTMEEERDCLGCAKFVTAIREFQKKHENTAVLFGGDNYKGDPVSEHLEGKPVSDMMRLMGVQVSVLGNHEFDFSTELLRKWQAEGNYSFLAANLVDRNTQGIPNFAEPYRVLSVGGLKILIVGVVLPERLATVDRPKEMEAYEILNTECTIQRINRIVSQMAGKVHAAVLLTHYGLRYRENGNDVMGEEAIELCKKISGVAGVFVAHFHQFMALELYGIAVSQGGGKGQGFGWIRLDFDEQDRFVKAVPGYEDLRTKGERIVPNPEMALLWNQYRKEAMKELGRVLAVLPHPIWHRNPEDFEVNPEGTALSSLVLKIMKEKTNCPIALFYSGRISEGFPEGELTLYRLYQMVFFPIKIVTMDIKGKEIRRNIETGLRTLKVDGASPIAVDGVLVKADFSKPYGQRIQELTLSDGQPLEMDLEYRIAVDDFLADHSMGFEFSNARHIERTGISVRECMIDTIQKDGLVETITKGIQIVDKNKRKLGGMRYGGTP